MKRGTCFIGGAALAVGIGCSSGDDVYVPTGSQQSALGCTLQSGEDLCARDWSEVAPEHRDEAIALLDSVAAFAGEAREMADETELACSEILTKLDISPPSIPSDATTAARVDAICDAATAAIDQRLSTPPVLEFEVTQRGECTRVAAPACLPPGTQRVQCGTTAARFVAENAATNADRVFGLAIEGAVVRIENVAQRATLVMENGATVSTNMQKMGTLGLPGCLEDNTAALLKQGVDDLNASWAFVSGITERLADDASSSLPPSEPEGD